MNEWTSRRARAARRTAWTRVALAALLTGASVLAGPTAWTTSAGAVVGGTVDGAAHPYVAMVVVPGGTRPTCTGVLLSVAGRAVVLSDAHCFWHGSYSGTGVRVAFASQWSTGVTTYPGTFFVDPAYSPSTAAHDLAVVVLTRAPAAYPALLAPLGTADGRVARLTTVGTGYSHAGQRWAASEIVTGHTAARVYLRSGSGNSCTGDSGGPDLLPGTRFVVALTDEGSCSVDLDTRVDTPSTRDLLGSVAGIQVGAALSASTTRAGSAVRLSGRVTWAPAGSTLLRQGWFTGAWHTWDSQRLSTGGGYAFVVRPTVATTDRYRVLVVGTSRHPGVVSRTVTLTVR